MRLGLVLLVAASVAATLAFSAAGSDARSRAPLVYWGALIGKQLTGSSPPGDMTAASAFEHEVGKSMSLIKFGLAWHSCEPDCEMVDFPASSLDAIRAHGSIPILDWASYSYPYTVSEPGYSLPVIASGRYDDFLRQFAAAAAAWGHPFFLRFDWEMNLARTWPWSEGSNGNAPGDFVRAWRHVHDVFASAGATNVTWVWCPNRVEDGDIPLSGLYPGDGYVDWTCVDAFNWGTHQPHPWGWRSFADEFAGSYRALRTLAPRKPIMIGETASSEDGGSKAAWIADALRTLPRRFPDVRAFVWFEAYADGMDWPVETSPAAVAAFAAGIRSPVYAAASYQQLGGATVKPSSRPVNARSTKPAGP